MIIVERATLAHAEAMAPRMRREDSTEVHALGMTPLEALRHSLDGSFIAEVALADGEPVAMWGACCEALAGGKAFLWMLGTDFVPANPRLLLRGSASFVKHVQGQFPLLECLVDMRYDKAVRWIFWMGFNQVATVPFNGVDFALCHREASSGY